jgi:hypothetical protein
MTAVVLQRLQRRGDADGDDIPPALSSGGICLRSAMPVTLMGESEDLIAWSMNSVNSCRAK